MTDRSGETILRATAYAPASVGNAAVGFDLLGFAFDVAGDRVTVERIEEREVRMRSPGALPRDPMANTAGRGLAAMIEDLSLAHGFAVTVEKGISLGSGMGGSAASAVAATVAANALLAAPLNEDDLLTYALIGESAATEAHHPDNVAPCLLGGLISARVSERGDARRPRVDALRVPVPDGVWCAIAKPRAALETKASRAALRADVPLRDHVRQAGHLAEFLIACHQNKIDLIARSLRDVLVEPQRAALVPGFVEAKAAAMACDALGCSIAGAGPSVFAWARGEAHALDVAAAMASAFARLGIESDRWTAPLPSPGARIIA